MSPAVQAYQDEIINGALASLIAKSKEIGGIVEQHVSLCVFYTSMQEADDTRQLFSGHCVRLSSISSN
jgi:hypothetical protein